MPVYTAFGCPNEGCVNTEEDVIRTVRLKNTQFTLIGTAHVSQKSVEMVEKMIRSGKFDCVAVELCEPRYKNLTNRSWWKNLDIFQIIKQKRAGLLLVNLALTAYQKRLGEKLGVEPLQKTESKILGYVSEGVGVGQGQGRR